MTPEEKKKKNKAIDRTNAIKTAGKVLKGIKAVSNALGTSPTETPDVDTKLTKRYGDDGTTGDNSGTREYKIDDNGVGGFDDEPKPRRMRDPRKRTAY
tara:strand:+ start:14641 stop:14934 length:294 start_codon:yes stop_codon:yes gene_type:complete